MSSVFHDILRAIASAMEVPVVIGLIVFIAFTLLHAYLANIEGIAPTLLMFFHKEHGGLVYDPDIHNIIGEDDMGHGEKH